METLTKKYIYIKIEIHFSDKNGPYLARVSKFNTNYVVMAWRLKELKHRLDARIKTVGDADV